MSVVFRRVLLGCVASRGGKGIGRGILTLLTLAQRWLVTDVQRPMAIVLLVVETTSIAQGVLTIQRPTPEGRCCDLAIEALQGSRGSNRRLFGLDCRPCSCSSSRRAALGFARLCAAFVVTAASGIVVVVAAVEMD